MLNIKLKTFLQTSIGILEIQMFKKGRFVNISNFKYNFMALD
jgi:hypothetical protein